MSIKILGERLKHKYNHASAGEKVTMIHLFAIENAGEILNSKTSAKEIVLAAGLPESYATEVSKGVKLAKYVSVK